MITTFKLDAGTFQYGISVVITDELNKAASFVNKRLKTSYGKEEFDCLGKVFFQHGVYPILWLPRIPETVPEQGTLTHELLHLVFEVTAWAGISLSSSSEEIYTHLLKYLYIQFHDKVNKRLHNRKGGKGTSLSPSKTSKTIRGSKKRS